MWWFCKCSVHRFLIRVFSTKHVATEESSMLDSMFLTPRCLNYFNLYIDSFSLPDFLSMASSVHNSPTWCPSYFYFVWIYFKYLITAFIQIPSSWLVCSVSEAVFGMFPAHRSQHLSQLWTFSSLVKEPCACSSLASVPRPCNHRPIPVSSCQLWVLLSLLVSLLIFSLLDVFLFHF